MSNDHVRNLIDKLLIEDLNADENLFLLKKLEEFPELNDYYNETVKLKDELQSIQETKPFSKADLNDARQTFFSSIEEQASDYSYLRYAAAILFGVMISFGSMYFSSSEIEQQIASLDVQQLDNGKIILTGQKTSSFEMTGTMKDANIQNVLINFVRTNQNTGHKFSAMDALSNIKEDRKELIDVYLDLAKNESNLGLRLKAIQNLSLYVEIKHVQLSLISLLKSEGSDVIRNAVFDALNTLHTDQFNELMPEIESVESPYIKQVNMKKGI